MTYWSISRPAREAAAGIRANAARIAATLSTGSATMSTVDAARLQLRLIRENCDALERELGGAVADAA